MINKNNTNADTIGKECLDNLDGYLNVGNSDVGYDELVPVTLASKITGLSPRSLRRLTARNEIPLYRYSSNTVRYLVRDLLEWSEGHRDVLSASHDRAASA